MAKRKKNKKGRGSVAEETQTNPAADETDAPSADEEIAGVASDQSDAQVPAGAESEMSAHEAASEEAPAQEQPGEELSAQAVTEDACEETAEETTEDAPQETTEEAAEETTEKTTDDTTDEAAEDAPAEEVVVDEGEEALGEVSSAESDESAGDGVGSDDATDRLDAGNPDVPAESPDESVWGDEGPTNPRVSESGTAEGESGTSEEDAKVWESTGEASEAAPAGDGASDEAKPLDIPRMQSIIESLLFASDRALTMSDFKRLLDERDGKKIQAALEDLAERRRESGIHVVHLATGWHLRTNHENGDWVSKLLAGKPMRLSRAMMETLAIVAYRQPVTRPEIDDIRGVDCGPVLKTLLDRGLIRIIGKKEEVGRPMLYGTTPEFLRVFNLRDLSDLPTLREFYELSEDQQAHVSSKHGAAPEGAAGEAGPGEGASGEGAPDGAALPTGTPTSKKEPPKLSFVARQDLPPDDEDADPLLDELEDATKAATKALGQPTEPAPATPDEAPAAEAEPEKQETPSES
jgi:segregation and condensation protein B